MKHFWFVSNSWMPCIFDKINLYFLNFFIIFQNFQKKWLIAYRTVSLQILWFWFTSVKYYNEFYSSEIDYHYRYHYDNIMRRNGNFSSYKNNFFFLIKCFIVIKFYSHIYVMIIDIKFWQLIFLQFFSTLTFSIFAIIKSQ